MNHKKYDEKMLKRLERKNLRKLHGQYEKHQEKY